MRRPFPLHAAPLALLVAAALGSAASRAAAQPGFKAPMIYQSIQGTIERVDTRLNGIILKGSDGKRHAWQLRPLVIKEAARYKPGDAMWVIYRSIDGGDRAVTAIGFPGSEEKPHYVNATGDTVVLRTGPYTEGACKPVAPEQMREHVLRSGSDLEDEAACWCCAPRNGECQLANRSHDERGTGRIVLSRCFS
jgi:hypothetical protein